MKPQRIIRTVLTCAVLSVALAGGTAWADLTTEQASALYHKARSGDKAALETLMAEACKDNPDEPSGQSAQSPGRIPGRANSQQALIFDSNAIHTTARHA
jgi:hypothetical protein